MTQLEALQERGIHRVGTPARGFRYRRRGGRLTARDLERIRELKIPPAWRDVYIDPSPRAKLQAVGRDKAGRWQYRYHPEFRSKQERKKFERIVHFARALPRMRKTIEADLRLPGMPRQKVMACILRILACCFIRPGSQVYADENGSVGIATLRAKHVKVRGDVVVFDFPGKSGKQQYRELKDRRVARIIRQLLKMPGHDVFKFYADDGAIIDVRRRHINEYIREVMGGSFTAKDFRTWAGTLICACALARRGCAAGRNEREVKRQVTAAVKEAAEHLGNTPAICRSSYIYPSVLSYFERGRVVERYFENVQELAEWNGRGLHGSERALVTLLESGSQAIH